MKRYSTNYPLIFGIVFLVVGIIVEQIPFVLLFGVLPIVVSIVLKCNEHRAKKHKEETNAKKDNKMNQASVNPSPKTAPPKKVCCARCGVDLSLISFRLVKKIGDKKYCDVCAQMMLRTAEHTASPPDVKQYQICARCHRILLENQSVWMGNHRFCRDCAKLHTEVKTAANAADNQEQKNLQAQRLTNVLVQIQNVKKEEILTDICSVCRRLFPDDKLIYVDGDYYCEDCYSFTHNKENVETTVLTNDLHQINYEISGPLNPSLQARIVEIADRLIAGGFRFHRADVGGGADEISHSGVMAYQAAYTDYDDFKNNMERDHRNREQEECKSSGGWISSLEYAYICAFLSLRSLRVCILSENRRVILRWIDTSEDSFATTRVFAENVIEEVYDNQCTLKELGDQELNSAFLRNWE